MTRSFILHRGFAAALFCGWFASSAAAATLAGATIPDTYTVDGQSLVLNGIGLRTITFIGIKAYVAGLYLPRPSHDARQILASSDPKVIILKFIHGASKARIEKQYRAGEAENCGDGACDPSDEGDFEHLVAVAPAVKPGDTTTYVIADQGVRVYANDQLIDAFKNRDLGFRLLSGFIGDHPPTPELRRAMLGLPPN